MPVEIYQVAEHDCDMPALASSFRGWRRSPPPQSILVQISLWAVVLSRTQDSYCVK